MKRLTILVASLFVLAPGGPTGTVQAKEADDSYRCWLFCESYRMMCEQALTNNPEYCEAFYEGCIDGCQYVP
jgi:hypothetical protein